jgi:hypothetical protein
MRRGRFRSRRHGSPDLRPASHANNQDVSGVEARQDGGRWSVVAVARLDGEGIMFKCPRPAPPRTRRRPTSTDIAVCSARACPPAHTSSGSGITVSQAGQLTRCARLAVQPVAVALTRRARPDARSGSRAPPGWPRPPPRSSRRTAPHETKETPSPAGRTVRSRTKTHGSDVVHALLQRRQLTSGSRSDMPVPRRSKRISREKAASRSRKRPSGGTSQPYSTFETQPCTSTRSSAPSPTA